MNASSQNASPGNNKVAAMLKVLFSEVTSLPTYLSRSLDVSVLLLDNDKPKYKELIETTLVALPEGAKPLPLTHSLQCCSHQEEIILRVIERIRRRDGHGKNLLTLGFKQMSDNPHAQISTSPTIEQFCHNWNAHVLMTVPWKTLLTRMGDLLMQHMLEHTALFIRAHTGCYIQISGKPVYDLWAFTPHTNVEIPSLSLQRKKPWHFRKSKRNECGRKPTARTHKNTAKSFEETHAHPKGREHTRDRHNVPSLNKNSLKRKRRLNRKATEKDDVEPQSKKKKVPTATLR